MRPGGSGDFTTIDKVVRGHVKKARITSADVLADALDRVYKKLKEQIQNHSDLDADIQRSRIPDHLKLLVFLSNAPTSITLATAKAIIDKIDNSQPEKTKLTWNDILAEEPLEGQHWEGVYGLPPGSTVENWGSRSDGSAPSLSPWDSESDVDESRSASRLSHIPETPPTPPADEHGLEVPRLDPPLHPMNAYRHRQDVEELHSRQYWRSDWRSDASVSRQFDLGDASSLAPSFHRVLGSRAVLSIDGPSTENYRQEQDVVREVITGLQGRRNMMLTWVHTGPEAFLFVLSPSAPRLLHLTAGAQASIISSFASLATTLVHLRKFTSAIFSKASGRTLPTSDSQGQPAYLSRAQRRSTQTLEAFADALETEILAFDAWCAQREEDICHARAGFGGKLVVSLLSLKKAIRDNFSTSFPVILDIVRTVVRRSQRLHAKDETPEIWTLPDLPQRASPSTITAILLDALLVAAQDHVSMGDSVTSCAIVRVFTASAEPVWSMIYRWMRDGMPVRDGQLGALAHTTQAQVHHSPLRVLQDEFFVEDNEMLMLDPDFWADGFALRDGHQGSDGADVEGRPTSVPVFLVHVAGLVLATGRVTGLLRVLGISSLFDGEPLEDGTTTKPWMAGWRSFKTLLERPQVHKLVDGAGEVTGSSEGTVASSENLSRIVYDELLPYSEVAHEALRRVLVDECELWAHLNTMEDLFLMRRGDAMSHFVDILFTRMDTRERWNDFHFMNSAFRDVVALYSGRTRWVDASLVRFSFPKVQGQGALQEKNIAQTVRALDGLLIEYAVPFPLTYIFGPRTTRVYSSIFTLVLQIRRAKSVLERILVRGGLAAGKQLDAEMKVFYAMRGRLSWFVNTLLNFITTNVLHTQILKFHEAFREAKSFDDMIRLQNEHLDKLEGRCLLQKNTVALHRAIMSILDMSLHYTECFVSFAGDTTHDISRASLVSRHRHRSRRLRKQRRNVIAFSDASSFLHDSEDVSSDEEGLDEESLAGHSGREPSFSFGASTTTASFTEDGFLARLDKMSSELDALVRFVRRGVESLAAGASEAAPAFGIFAFALEDWDR
ncbi:Spc98 family-domain-containing protein [Ganoderma leucocontextum]|nr:Spc98 family-domain-containing protein [Ganoderma leucocontextum]